MGVKNLKILRDIILGGLDVTKTEDLKGRFIGRVWE